MNSGYAVLILAALLVAAFLVPGAAAQQTESVHATSAGTELRYLVHRPPVSEGERPPLIVFLHGAGERGDDLARVKKHGPPMLAERDPEFPFVVVSPQCPSGQWWDIDALLELVQHAVATERIDPQRVYLTGLSMGGYGSWSLAARAPELFAAVAPICGGGEASTAARMASVPIWAFHGAKDRVVPAAQSRDLVEALRALKAPVKYTEYPEARHDSWSETYDDPAFYAWLLEHRRRPALPRATPASCGVSPERLQQAQARVDEVIEEGTLVSAITVVSRDGKLIHETVRGFQDRESRTPLRLDSIFRIFSMTKPITSVAVMMLVEEGALGLDDPVADHLPEFEGIRVYASGTVEDFETTASKRPMTVRDLLRHTSGLTYGVFGNSVVDQLVRKAGAGDPEVALDEFSRRLAGVPLLDQPGERWLYSLATDLLGRVVEVASEQPYDEFLQERIFGPLHMVDTGFHVPPEKLHRLTTSYGPSEGGGLRVVDHPDRTRLQRPAVYHSGGGGLVSTARDYLHFAQMLASGGELFGTRLLEVDTVAEMTRNQLDEGLMRAGGVFGDRDLGFGLGFSVRGKEGRGAPAGEFGWGGYASTDFWISPEHRLVVMTLSQHSPPLPVLPGIMKPAVYEAIRSAESSGGE